MAADASLEAQGPRCYLCWKQLPNRQAKEEEGSVQEGTCGWMPSLFRPTWLSCKGHSSLFRVHFLGEPRCAPSSACALADPSLDQKELKLPPLLLLILEVGVPSCSVLLTPPCLGTKF